MSFTNTNPEESIKEFIKSAMAIISNTRLEEFPFKYAEVSQVNKEAKDWLQHLESSRLDIETGLDVLWIQEDLLASNIAVLKMITQWFEACQQAHAPIEALEMQIKSLPRYR